MAQRFAVTGGSWTDTNIWNDGTNLGIPTSDDDVFSNGFNVNMDISATVISLNNTSFYLRVPNAAIPIMTSNVTPSGIVAASSILSTAVDSWFAFDGSTGTRWQSGALNTGWLRYQFPTPRTIKRYAVASAGSGIAGGTSSNISSWTFEGSNDATNWTILDTRTGLILADFQYSDNTFTNNTGFTFYRINVTATRAAGNYPNISDLQMTESTQNATGQSAGGSFNFNTAGVTVSCDLVRQGATNLFTITNTTGTTSLSVANSISPLSNQTTMTNSGAGDFTLTVPNLSMQNNTGTSIIINKTGSGLLTVNGNLLPTLSTQNNLTLYNIQSTNGDVIINGDVFGPLNTGAITNGSYQTIRQTVGNLTINGNLTPSRTTVSSVVAIDFQGNTITLNGNTNDTTGTGILSRGTVNIIGNLNGSNSVVANTTITINVTGNTYAGLGPTINCSAFPSSVVNLTGNMYNNLGWNAIWCPNLFISNSATTLWRMDVGGGLTKTLYSSDTFPNQPSTSLVRRNTVYGPSNTLTGTTYMPIQSNIRSGVIYDNGIIGTGTLTAQDIINYISSSNDSLAVRLRNILTVEQAGNIIKENNV